MRVLVVDDDEAIRAAVSELLRDEGYEVECAATGAQALEALQESPELFGVVVLDLMMPEMNGWELLDTLRADASLQRVPVIILSAFNGVGGKLSLHKPIDADVLLAAVRRYDHP
jgi:CheY-like chemotaxis protein